MNKFYKLKIGTPITGWDIHFYDNYVVVCLGYNWAVLTDESGRNIASTVLQPTDDFLIGEHKYCMETERMALVEG